MRRVALHGALCAIVFAASTLTGTTAHADEIGKWRRHVIALDNSTYAGNPFEIVVDAVFTHPGTGQTLTLPGYYDGNDTWKVGFMPTELGNWTWMTVSSDADLNGVTGSVDCIASGLPGFLGPDPDHPRKWRYSEGPYVVPMGFRMEFFFENSTTAQFLAAADFLASEVRGQFYETRLLDEEGIYDDRHDYIFEGNWQNHQFDLTNWTRFEARLEALTERGVGAAIMFYSDEQGQPPWGAYSDTEELAIRYVVARTCGYPVISFNTGIDIAEYRDGDWIDWFGAELQALDPYDHPISSRHGGPGNGSHVMATQTFDSAGVPVTALVEAMVDHFEVSSTPVSMDDAWGENRPSHPEKDHTEQDIRRAFWKCLVAGGVGGLVRGSDGYFHIDDVAQDLESEQWLGRINPFLAQRLGGIFGDMVPQEALVSSNAHAVADPARHRIVCLAVGAGDSYDTGGGPLDVHLESVPASETRDASWFDPRTGNEYVLGPLSGGTTHVLNPPSSDDWVLLLTDSFGFDAPPEVSIGADVTVVPAGSPVTFTVTASDDGNIVSHQWNLGNQTIAVAGPPPATFTHSWSDPGTQVVQLLVTDDATPPHTVSSSAINISVQTALTVNIVADITEGPAPLSVQLDAVASGGGSGTPAFAEANGTVTVEAEHYASSSLRSDPNGVQWVVATAEGGYVGDGYVTTPGPLGERATWDDGCELTYDMFFSTVGAYTVWLRRASPGGSSDSCFLGVDDTQLGGVIDNQGGSSWLWRNAITLTVSTPGLHTLQLRRREVGYCVDRIHLTQTGVAPSGLGPLESPELEGYTYAWDLGDGTTSSAAEVTHTYDVPGNYDATVTVTTNGGISETASVTLTAQSSNQAPQVDAGPDQLVLFGLSLTLSGSVTDDGLPDPPATAFVNWSALSGPGIVTFDDPSRVDAVATFSGPGIYVLELSGDDSELVTTDTVTIDIQSPPNQAPSVEAGPDFAVALPASGSLAATVTDDGMPDPPGEITVIWVLVAGPAPVAFDDPASSTTEVTFSQPGSYILGIGATDGQITGADYLTVTVTPPTNQPPAVSAGADQVVVLPSAALLDGTVTDDGLPDPPGMVTSTWTLVSGPGPVSFGDPGTIDTTANFVVAGLYVLELAATDGELSAADSVTILVEPVANQAPAVSAGGGQTIPLAGVATLDGTVLDDGLPDPPGAVTTLWSVSSGPGSVTFADESAVDTTASFSAPGLYELQLAADDGELTTSDSLWIDVQAPPNAAPGVSAGGNQMIELGDEASLDGTVTDDGLPDPPGVVTSLWSVDSGPGTVTFADPNLPDTTATFDLAGDYVLRLTANDGESSASDTVSVAVVVPVVNVAPTVDAGSDQSVVFPGGAALDGTVTDDGLPDPPGAVTSQWSVFSGPGVVTFADAADPDTGATFSSPGTYVLTLTGDDGALQGSDTVAIDVLPPPNQPPVVSAGVDLGVVLPGVANLDGTVGDDGLPDPPGSVTTAWTLVGGPGLVVFGDPSVVDTTATFSTPGSYELALMADDGAAQVSDTVTVDVQPPLNQPPVVSAGADQEIAWPLADALLDGTATDDGLPSPPGFLTTTWSVASGPGSVVFADPGAPDTTTTFEAPGVYVLELAGFDGAEQSVDAVTVSVLEANTPPTVDAGADQVVEISTGAALSGTVTDDGLPDPPGSVTVAWSLADGPGVVVFGDESSAQTTATFSEPGSYTLDLTASDGEFSATDSVEITVDDPSLVTAYASADPTSGLLPLAVQFTGDATIMGSPPGGGGFGGIFQELGGMVVVEAEDFTGESPGTDPNGVIWELQTTVPGYAGDGFVTTPGPHGINGTWGNGCELSYDIDFDTPGSYTLWIRRRASDSSSNSAWVGIDGAALGGVFDNVSYGNWSWVPCSVPVSLTTGTHVLQIRRREAQYQIDRFLLTDDPGFVPQGEGPGPSMQGVVLEFDWDFGDGNTSRAQSPGHIYTTPGIHVATLMVTYGDATATDSVTIDAQTPPNSPATVDAGPDLDVLLPSGADLLGSVMDDGLPSPPGMVTISWSVLSGPGAVTFDDVASPQTTAMFSVEGIYLLELAADDGELVAVDTVTVDVLAPIPGDNYEPDADTLALYHFDGDHQDASGNGFDLAVTGGVELVSDNLGWMQNPAGQVARFSSIGDILTVSLPDEPLLPSADVAITIDARIFARDFLAWGIANLEVLTLRQEWDANLSLNDGRWNNPQNPTVAAGSTEVVDAQTWSEHVTLDEWHHVRVVYNSGVVRAFVDDVLIGEAAVTPNASRGGDWILILGNFDGDLDEIRISTVERTD